MAKFVAFLSTICLFFALLAIILYLGLFRRGGASASLDAAGIVKEVRQLNELTTVRYSIEKVIGIKEEKSPLGMESILLLVRGKVIAGIDLSEVSANDVDVSRPEMVRIRLGKPHIQEAFLDEKFTQVWDRSITWWTPWVTPDPDLEHKARMRAVDDIKAEALAMGILGEAQRNAERDIRNTLQVFGMKKVVFEGAD